MMAFSRVAYVCQCPTTVPVPPDPALDIQIRAGGEADLLRLPEEIRPPGRVDRLRARLREGEIFLLGERGGQIVSCTWIRRGGTFTLQGLPDHPFRLAPSAGYGYDAFTDPALRGQGLRRAVFAEELRLLRRLGASWEISYFVDHQLEGGRQSLAQIGVPLMPLWKVTALPGGRAAVVALSDHGAAVPCFAPADEEEIARDAR